MNQTLLLFLISLSLKAFPQSNPTELAKPIVEEGKRLYRSEMASWHGTDVFLEHCDDRSKIGGYFSYVENEAVTCIFFSASDNPNVIGTIVFDSTYNTKTARIDLAKRPFTELEKGLYTIRKTALEAIRTDSLFKTYENTNFNLIPLVDGNEKKVYVLTGTSQRGVVIFGNDYLLTFDAENKLIGKRQLHKNIMPANYGNEEGGKAFGGMHTHLPETGDFITATDICTLMLYGKFTKWEQYNVISEKYLNIWNCQKNELFVMTMEAVEKINKHQEKRKGKMKKGD